MNPRLHTLPRYPFQRLRDLLADLTPADLPHVSMDVGAPKHPVPQVFLDGLNASLDDFSCYPTTGGSTPLREAIATWLMGRFQLPHIDPVGQVLPCAGTREALFGIAQLVLDRSSAPVVLIPNPFYQIYRGAALWADAAPVYVPATAGNGFLPDYAGLPTEILDRTALLYLCTPGNPSGRVAPRAELIRLIELADRHDFLIVSDECYSEIYPDEANPPPGILEAAAHMGRTGFSRCLAFHSLSKRSNLPGARSGFMAGDATVLADFFQLRTYTGNSIPLPIQAGSAAAWADEAHVRANRDAYRAKFAAVAEILAPVRDTPLPDAGFYLWLPTPEGDEAFARTAYERCNMTVLPGSYLAETEHDGNPGAGYVRMALVDSVAACTEAATRIRERVSTS